MGRSQSTETPIAVDDAEILLDIAELTVATALFGGRPTLPPLEHLPRSLQARVGAFVTLTVAGELNGCIGNVEGIEPIGYAVARLALSAAFGDPRLPALRPVDYPQLTIELSLLSGLSVIAAGSRGDLLRALRPHEDGVVVTAGPRQGLFLPSVWEQLPSPDDFLDHLWIKAGLTPRTWPTDLRAFRFTAERYRRRAGTGGAYAAA
jgi:AmmeMemoRadiSam system protein A